MAVTRLPGKVIDPQHAANSRKYLTVPVLYTAGFALLVPLLSRPAAVVLAGYGRAVGGPGLVAGWPGCSTTTS